MNTYKLKDVLGVRYLHNYYETQIREFVDSVVNEGTKDNPVIIDIAGTRFTPDIASQINTLISPTVKFISSENEQDNKILEYNYNLKNVDDAIELPKYNPSENIVAYLKTLQPGYSYKLPEENKNVYIPIITLGIMFRPRIEFDISECVLEVMRLICKTLNKQDIKLFTRDTNNYCYYYKNNLIEFTTDVKNDEELFYVYGIGNVTWSKLLEEHYVIPSYLGVMNVSDPSVAELWQDTIKEIINEINETTERQTLAGFLKEDD